LRQTSRLPFDEEEERNLDAEDPPTFLYLLSTLTLGRLVNSENGIRVNV
jgi:hypothetical protein